MFGWGANQPSGIFSGVKSFAEGLLASSKKPFENGIAKGIDKIISNAWQSVTTHPYTTFTLIAVGGATIYAYRNSRYVNKLGEWHLTFHENFSNAIHNLFSNNNKVRSRKASQDTNSDVYSRLNEIKGILSNFIEQQEANTKEMKLLIIKKFTELTKGQAALLEQAEYIDKKNQYRIQ